MALVLDLFWWRKRARLRLSETRAPLDQGGQDRRTGAGPKTEEMKLRADELRKVPAVELLTRHGATPLSAARWQPEMRDRCTDRSPARKSVAP
jgi:hypothetical protein